MSTAAICEQLFSQAELYSLVVCNDDFLLSEQHEHVLNEHRTR